MAAHPIVTVKRRRVIEALKEGRPKTKIAAREQIPEDGSALASPVQGARRRQAPGLEHAAERFLERFLELREFTATQLA